MEIWKPIPLDTLKDYEVSNEGDIRHKKFQKKVKFKNLRGHLTFRYKSTKGQGTFLVHRLVALAFIPNPNSFPIVNHLNGDRGDNRVENLEWTTASGNVVHGLKRRKKVKSNMIKQLYKSKQWKDVDSFYKEVLQLFE